MPRLSRNRQKIGVSVQMSRNSNGQWGMTISDDTSGLAIVSVELNHEQFSDMMSGMYTHGTAEYYGSPNIGKKLVTISHNVDLTKLVDVFTSYEDKARARDMKHIYDLAEEQNPGFTADRDDHNSHRHNYSEKTYKVTLRKYEEPK